VALHYLRIWWLLCGRPESTVPVFGLIRDHRGKGAHGRKGEKITYAASYAKRWRNALLTAGITRRELFGRARSPCAWISTHSAARTPPRSQRSTPMAALNAAHRSPKPIDAQFVRDAQRHDAQCPRRRCRKCRSARPCRAQRLAFAAH
jgi:hypothetical protein